ncbi:glucose-1-phosphate adenylyltransferase subunit GlgD [Gracilibacillus marinus]|jgi:glucose-1-phosphate adenylyltransferase|uniref:Glucose-1-phosphate adenylyltransferase subunit GlgD n=1 Tax=Gracilibacillus marinus TaxID=630535 RepID=A0ABV8VR25_9BACI
MKRTVGIITNSSNMTNLDGLIGHRSIHTIPIGGKYRLIDFPLSNLVNLNEDIYIGVIGSYNYRSLVDHLKQGQDWNLSRKSNDLLVLQGDRSVKIAPVGRLSVQDFLDNEPFFDKLPEEVENIIISGCNIVANLEMEKILEEHQETNADITMLYKQNYQGYMLDQELFLQLENNEVKKIYYSSNKVQNQNLFIDTFIIKRTVFLNMLREAKRRRIIDFIEIIQQCLDQIHIHSYPVSGYVKMIHSLQAYYECSMELIKCATHVELFKNQRKIYTKSKDNHPTVYGQLAKVKRAMVASGAIVNGSIEDSIVFRNTNIGHGAKVKNSIIMQGAVVGEDAVVVNAILDKNVRIRPGEFITSHTTEPILIKKRSD